MAVFYRYDYIEITNNIHPWHQDSRRFQPCHDDVFEHLLGVLILLFRVWPRAATRSHIWRIKRKRGDIDLVVFAVHLWNKYGELPHLNVTGTGSWNKSGRRRGRTETRPGLRLSMDALHITFRHHRNKYGFIWVFSTRLCTKYCFSRADLTMD